MFYQFPTGLSLAEVRHVVHSHNDATGTKAFIESDKGDHVIFNYVVSFQGSFPEPTTGNPATDRFNAILRECRGITFDKATGRVRTRKFQKFFNANEKPETQVGQIDWGRPHVILEKLDGSMLTPYRRNGEIEWHTKMGATDVAKPVQAFVSDNPAYRSFVYGWMETGFTPIFEWCSRQQKIVIDYPQDRLVLTAIRCNDTGRYLTHGEMLNAAEPFGIPVVEALPGSVDNIHHFMEKARDLKGAEGYVIRFADGHMVKVKAEEYVRIHKVKEALTFEKDVWSMVLSDSIDDVKAMMDEGDRRRVDAFEDALNRAIFDKAGQLACEVERARDIVGPDKKRFAIEFASKAQPLDRSLMFMVWDGKDPEQSVRSVVSGYTSTSTKIETVRPWLNGVTWNDYRDHNLRLDD